MSLGLIGPGKPGLPLECNRQRHRRQDRQGNLKQQPIRRQSPSPRQFLSAVWVVQASEKPAILYL